MPTFNHEEASHYDERITRLVPGYALLHQATAAQLVSTLDNDACILVIGAGTGKEIIELAKLNAGWRFIAQDISQDMLDIAEQHFSQHNISDRVTVHCGDINDIDASADAALCLLVMHFVEDNGDKKALLKAIKSKLKKQGNLFIADLMRPETQFERESQLQLCTQLGLTDAGKERTRHNLEHEFYPLDRIRFSELMNESGFSTPKQYFKVLGFTGYVVGS
ncbi:MULTISPECIES: class I SAM-dependent methyltransferase [Pseudoalteromonas]|jgi:tRNA (cmo5U34)-methyltransferase|uniref:class I SAM-dependent methyltransferase n=1 Tax=Pseudoalteromonas TaxID=53246 RepID=UPI00044E3A31|nr:MULTISPECIES: class I SAM-dependent methyltransferase [Pseudoalteromonas]EWH05574.1 SAM-dependent methyltransferase [Pseudoalteromonas lipolytica SCSIO 04301]MCC9662750.1 class I SAM-dependent methyltransferase [Pseudoalteromonas sp. MB41]QMW16670.1 class I SAM-dependent methyltransferase [Pseudoalteromonas sp. MT33b]|tara:strand:+ start:5737 stop:6399 length:663 start_codon:yes stop_codon:yes gene_type:complete